MMNPRECPECGDYNTERQHVEHMTTVIEVVRTCDECLTQYTVSYGDPVVRDVQTFD